MSLPDRRFPKLHAAAWREPILRDVPALELSPVIPWLLRLDDPRRVARHGLAPQDSDGDARALLALQLRLVEAAADDAQAQLVLEEAVDGGVRGRPEALEGLVLVVGHSARVPHEQGQQDERARGQGGHPAEHLFEGQVVEPREGHAIGEPRELPLHGLGPELLERRRPDHHHDVGRVRLELQDVLDEAGQVEVLAHEGGIASEVGRQGPAVHPGVDHRGAREQAIPILHDEATRRRSHRRDQVRLPLRQALEQELDERLLHVGLRVARHAEGDLVEIDGLAHLRGQGGLERGGVGRERRRAGAEGIDDQDPLRVSGGCLRLRAREQEQEQPERAPADDPHRKIASHRNGPGEPQELQAQGAPPKPRPAR